MIVSERCEKIVDFPLPSFVSLYSAGGPAYLCIGIGMFVNIYVNIRRHQHTTRVHRRTTGPRCHARSSGVGRDRDAYYYIYIVFYILLSGPNRPMAFTYHGS